MTAFTLKIIALSAMLIAHIGVAFPEGAPFWFRAIGRLAWPIFAYLLAEGFWHTKTPEMFLMRLFAFALISEVPYDLMKGNAVSFIADTNIFYTLFLGGMAVFLYERTQEKRSRQTMAVLTALLPTAVLAELLSVDYGGMGVLFIFAMYIIKPKTARLLAMGVFALSQFIPFVVAYSIGIEVPFEHLVMIPFALATVPLVALYNGKRGIAAKWLFYAAYPAHLVVLAVIAAMMN
jgi:hypothetical protein